MNRRIYLSTYIFELRSKRKSEKLFLSKLDGTTDFFDVFCNFITSLGNDPFGEDVDKERHFQKNLELAPDRDQHYSKETREVYGFLSSGINGEKSRISDTESGEDVFYMDRKHARMVDTYYHIRIPEDRKFAYLILQRHGGFGIKKLFEKALQDFLNKSKLNMQVDMSNFLVSRIFNKMLNEGRITEMSFIKNYIPDNIEDLYDKGEKRVVGKTKTIICTERGLPLPVKGFAYNLYMRDKSEGAIKVSQLYDQYDEVDFEIEYQGSKKTIHMSNVGKSLPDYDVTDSISFDYNDLPTVSSLKAQADILINDMIQYQEEKIRK